MIAVNRPAGIWIGAKRARPAKSARPTMSAPVKAVSTRCMPTPDRARRRARCGATSPTNPIGPDRGNGGCGQPHRQPYQCPACPNDADAQPGGDFFPEANGRERTGSPQQNWNRERRRDGEPGNFFPPRRMNRSGQPAKGGERAINIAIG